MRSKTSKIVELEQEVKTLKAAAEEEFENGQKNLEESNARIGQLKRKLEAMEDNKESEEQKVKELELVDVSDDQHHWEAVPLLTQEEPQMQIWGCLF